MKALQAFCLAFFAMLFMACATDITDLTGDISGTVSDKILQTPIEGCIVRVTPSNNATSTQASGNYSFQDLDAGSYKLAFEKDGYEKYSQSVEVVVGKQQIVNIFLNPIPINLTIMPEQLDFGDLTSSLELFISATSSTPIPFKITSDAEWITISPSEGTISSRTQTITIVADRSKVSEGRYSKNSRFPLPLELLMYL